MRRVGVLVPGLGLLLVLTGCSGTTGAVGRAVPAPAADVVGAAATTTPGAELRAGLTWQLVERPHELAALRSALHGGDAAAAREDRAVLDDGGDALARTTGVPTLSDLLSREVDAALGHGGPSLAAVHAGLAEALAAVAPTLDGDALARALDTADGPPGPTADTAASGAAALLAEALSAARGSGSAGSPAAVLRADLTGLLVGRSHLLGAAPDTPALTDLTGRLAAALTPGHDPGPVAAALRAEATALDAAARARVAHDDAGARAAGTALAAADRDLAGQVSRAASQLAPDVVAQALAARQPSLLGAVTARAAGDADAARLSADAGSHEVVLAAALAAGLADQRRLT